MHPFTRRRFLSASALGLLGAAGPAPAVTPVKRTGRTRLKLSLAAYSFRSVLPNYRGAKAPESTRMDMEGFVAYCADLGLDGAELTSYFLPDPCPPDLIHRLKRRAHLSGLDISGGAIGNNFAWDDGPELEQQLEYTERWIRAYAALGAPVIRVFAGQAPRDRGIDEDQAVRNIIRNLGTACEIAGRHGVMLAMENHDFTTKIDRFLEILQAVDSPWLGANLDSGNLAATPDPYAELARIVPYSVNAQLKVMIPVNGKKEPADLGRLVGLLRDGGYRGYVVLEYEEAEDPYTAVPRYLEEMQRLLAD